MTFSMGVCPECGCEDQIYFQHNRPLTRVQLGYNNDGDVTAEILLDDRHDALLPKHKFYCMNCSTGFDIPKRYDSK